MQARSSIQIAKHTLEQTYLYDMESAFEYPGNHFEPYNTILPAHDVWNCARTKDTSGHKPIFGVGLGLDWFLGNKTSGETDEIDEMGRLRMREKKK